MLLLCPRLCFIEGKITCLQGTIFFCINGLMELKSPNSLIPETIGPYKILGVIGEGAFSLVRLIIDNETGCYYACKIVPRTRLLQHNLEARFENEIRVNQQLHHEGIVTLYDLLKDDTYFYIVMEFCPNGELFRYIVQNGKLEEPQAQSIFLQILEALKYVHSQGICHRDLKPENILLDSFCSIKISDFGLSRFVGANGLVGTPCGSPCYASPECVSGKPYDGRKSDIWSCGVMLYAMLTGQLPWTKRNQQQLFEQIRKGDYVVPNYLSEQCKQFITGLMTVDPSRRLSLEEAISHPWLSNTQSLSSIRYEVKNQNKITPSLRKIDRFFDREESELDIPQILFPCLSMGTCSYESAKKILRTANSRSVMTRRRLSRPPQVAMMKPVFNC